MIKKLLAVLLVLIMAFGICSCSDNSDVNIRDGKKVAVYFTLDTSDSSVASVTIFTGMPIGMKVNVTIRAGKDKFYYDDELSVSGGSSENFLKTAALRDENGKPPKKGRLLVQVTSLPYSEQNEDVQNKIGKNGKYLINKDLQNQCVYDSDDGKVINYNLMLEYSNNSFVVAS